MNNRQTEILKFISTHKNASVSDLEHHIARTAFGDVSCITLIQNAVAALFKMIKRRHKESGKARN